MEAPARKKMGNGFGYSFVDIQSVRINQSPLRPVRQCDNRNNEEIGDTFPFGDVVFNNQCLWRISAAEQNRFRRSAAHQRCLLALRVQIASGSGGLPPGCENLVERSCRWSIGWCGQRFHQNHHHQWEAVPVTPQTRSKSNLALDRLSGLPQSRLFAVRYCRPSQHLFLRHDEDEGLKSTTNTRSICLYCCNNFSVCVLCVI